MECGMKTARQLSLLILRFAPIALVSSIVSLEARGGTPVLSLPGGRTFILNDPAEIEKKRLGRVVRIGTSRIELVPVAPESGGGEPDDERTQIRLADDCFDQLVFGPRTKGDDARLSAAAIVRVKIAAVERACQLTEAQIRKLELAGRGDIERLLDQVETARKRFEMYRVEDGNVPQIYDLASEARKVTVPLWDKLHSDIYDNPSSLFARTLRNVLTNEQAAKAGRLLPTQTDRRPATGESH